MFLGFLFVSPLPLMADSPALIHGWSDSYGSAGGNYCYAIATDGLGNVFIAGRGGNTVDFGGGPLSSTATWDVFLVKFDGDGNQATWSRTG